MVDQPLVSVLMTAYNREDYIAEAIESVLSSTYKNFELIIVDDGSVDSTVAIAKKYAQEDARIRVYINEQNLGDYNNRNKAASYATGKYIKYSDSDDLVYPHCLDVMVRCMEQFPSAAFGLVKPHSAEYTMPYPFLIEKPFEEYMKNQGLFSNSPGSAIINRAVFDKLGGFSGKRYVGDYEFWLKISQVTSLVIIPGFLGWDRTHEFQEKKFETQHYVVTEKLKIDILLDALNNSKLDNAVELKRSIVAQRNRINKKMLLSNILKLQFANAKNRYILSDYLIKRAR